MGGAERGGGGAGWGVGAGDSHRGETKSVSILLPEGAVGGQQLQTQVGADTVIFSVPPGAVGGQRLTVRYQSSPPAPHAHPRMPPPHGSPWHSQTPRYPWPSGPGYPSPGGSAAYAPNAGVSGGYAGYAGSSSSPRRPGRPPGALNLVNRPTIQRPPQLPPSPAQLTRRMVLLNREPEEAVKLAAQYNTSLFIINNDAIESGHVRILVPRGRRGGGRRPSASLDPGMTLVWHLSSQIPARALVLIQVHNSTVAERIAKFVQANGRPNVRPSLSWAPVRTFETTAKWMRTSGSGQPLVWRYQEDRWGYHDPDTREFVPEPLESVNRSVECLLPTLVETHQ